MSIDAPIIDEFEDGNPRRRSTWGFSSIKRTIAKSQMSNGMIGSSSTSRTIEKGDIKAKRKSWKDLANIREFLEGIDDSLKDVVNSDKKAQLNPSAMGSGSQERRRWFIKLRHQQQLITRLSGIEKNLKGKGSSGLGIFGMLGSLGAIGTLLSKLKGKGLGMLFGGLGTKAGGGIAGGIAKEVLKGLLTAVLAKTAIGQVVKGAGGLARMLAQLGVKGAKAGAGKAKTFGQKAIGSMGTMLKAGKARLMTAALPSAGIQGLMGALGGVSTAQGGSALTTAMRAVLPKILGRIGMAVFGVPGAVAMTAKLVWDHLLPASWKKYITYKVAKFYLAAIDKVASMFEWIANKFDALKNKITEFYDRALARVYAAMDFVGNLITGEGDARQRVKNYMSSMWNTLELTVGTYISGFVTVFKNAYNSFIKPFYDDKGNFSLIQGIKHYAKAGYNMGVGAINSAGAAVDSAVASTKKVLGDFLDSNYNPANWQKNSADYVAQYEAAQAAKAKNTPRDESSKLIAKTQDATRNTLDTLDKTLKSTNKYLQNATAATANFMGGDGSFGGSGASGSTITDFSGGRGGSLGAIVGKAESNNNYNAYNRGKAGDSKQGVYDFTKMTIGQVMSLQQQKKAFAVGKYQVVPTTMKEAVAALKLNTNQLFNEDMQEYIFQNYLVANKRRAVKGFVTGSSNDIAAAQMDIAREFASIGVPYSGREGSRAFNKGGSYYAGIGNNKASVSDAQSAAALREARAVYAQAKKEGKSDQEAWNAAFASSGGMGAANVSSNTAVATPSDSETSSAPTDTMGAILATMSNPEAARAAYSEAKAQYASPESSIIRNDDAINDILNRKVRVSSIGSQIDEDIRYPNDIGAVERAKREAAAKAQEVAQRSASAKATPPVSGSSQNALFNRINMANVQHENAFPV